MIADDLQNFSLEKKYYLANTKPMQTWLQRSYIACAMRMKVRYYFLYSACACILWLP